VKKIRKKKKLIVKTPAEEDRLPVFAMRLENFIRQNPQRAAVLGMVILFVIVFVSVYIPYSYKRQNKAVQALDKALASQTLGTKLLLLQDVVDEYGGTLGAARALYYLGDGYHADGQYDLARDRYEQYLQKYSQANFAPNAQEGLGYVAESQGKFGEAIQYYKTLVERYADSYVAQHAWYNIARCFEESGDWTSAVDAYEKQLALYPGSAWSAQAEARFGETRLRLPSAQPQQSPDETPAAESPAETVGQTSD
jgi:tetratricopeptide (TPR) repeat protein